MKRTDCGAGTVAHNDHGGSVFLRTPMGGMIGEEKAKCQVVSKCARIRLLHSGTEVGHASEGGGYSEDSGR